MSARLLMPLLLMAALLRAAEGRADACTADEASDGERMAYVPAGTFWAGCPRGDPLCGSGACSGGPCDEGYLCPGLRSTKAYYIDRHLATIAEFAACVGAGVCEPVPGIIPFDLQGTWYESGLSRLNEETGTWVATMTTPNLVEFCEWRGTRACSRLELEKALKGACEDLGCDSADADCCEGATPLYPWGNAGPTCSTVDACLYGDPCTKPVPAPSEEEGPYRRPSCHRDNDCGCSTWGMHTDRPEGSASLYGLIGVANAGGYLDTRVAATNSDEPACAGWALQACDTLDVGGCNMTVAGPIHIERIFPVAALCCMDAEP